MINFSIYDFLTDIVFCVDSNNKICYTNFAFQDEFDENIQDIKKIVSFFDFDIGILDNTHIFDINPILLALNSEQNYVCSAINVKNGQNYNIYAHKNQDYTVFTLQLQQNNVAEFDKKIKKLESENKKTEELNQKAQSQAVKIALLNRIYSIIQQENELSDILKLAFNELNQVFGVEKLYYLKNNNSQYVIEHIYPQEFNDTVGEILDIRYNSKKVYEAENIYRDFAIFDQPARSTIRVKIPILLGNKNTGFLIFNLPQKNYLMIDDDFMNSLCSQLSGAVSQALLSQELKENQLQLINSEKMASLGNMIASVAHEINTPLGSINSNNEMLTKLIKKHLENDKNNLVYQILNNSFECDKEAIKRIMTIVKALKKFIRLDEAQMQLTDVSKELDLTLNLCQHLIKNKVTVTKSYEQIPQIYTHPNMLNQVFMNIITNAIQSIENKGEVKISVYKQENYVVISIKDNGCGIPKDIQKLIFQQGFTTKQSDNGSGLGLSISQKIIEQLGGKLSFVSNENEGTEFFIHLPQN